MILKACFNTDMEFMRKIVNEYIKTNNNNAQLIITDSMTTLKTVVIGLDNEIMFLIGYIAGLGIHTLENVQEVKDLL